MDDEANACDVCGNEIDRHFVRQGLDVCEICAEAMAEADPEDAEFWDE